MTPANARETFRTRAAQPIPVENKRAGRSETVPDVVIDCLKMCKPSKQQAVRSKSSLNLAVFSYIGLGICSIDSGEQGGNIITTASIQGSKHEGFASLLRGSCASYFLQNQIVFDHVIQPITAKQQLVLRLQV
jgi:hypothetical protein